MLPQPFLRLEGLHICKALSHSSRAESTQPLGFVGGSRHAQLALSQTPAEVNAAICPLVGLEVDCMLLQRSPCQFVTRVRQHSV